MGASVASTWIGPTSQSASTVRGQKRAACCDFVDDT
jgi:hypothetical protein